MTWVYESGALGALMPLALLVGLWLRERGERSHGPLRRTSKAENTLKNTTAMDPYRTPNVPAVRADEELKHSWVDNDSYHDRCPVCGGGRVLRNGRWRIYKLVGGSGGGLCTFGDRWWCWWGKRKCHDTAVHTHAKCSSCSVVFKMNPPRA